MADQITGSNYHDGLSTSGIIFNGEDGIPRFSSRFNWIGFLHLPQVANHPINICSSSDGLVACHDPVSNIYYIGNPLIENSNIPLPETPRQHNPYSSNAVLVSDYSAEHRGHLVCAVLDGMTVYNFDVYSSYHGRWFSFERIDLESFITPNTGVSCGTFAYWLTEAPRSVIRFNINTPQDLIMRIPLQRSILGVPETTMMQLGRVGNKLGLVTLDAHRNPKVILYLLEEGNLWQFRTYLSFNLPMSSTAITRLIRFQSFKTELFFWINGRLLLWEENTVHQQGHLRMVNKGEVQIGYGLAHVTTPLLPEDFDMTIENTGRDDNTSRDDDDDDH